MLAKIAHMAKGVRGMATFTVNITADVVDGNYTQLSLREAVNQANSTIAADTIVFAATLEGQRLVLSGGELTLSIAASAVFANIDPETGGGQLNAVGIVPLLNNTNNPALSGADTLAAGATGQTGDSSAHCPQAACPTLARSR